MATKIRPIVFRVNEPEGFVMNAANATIRDNWIYWQSPAYPNGYEGGGKSYSIVNNNDDELEIVNGFMYLSNNPNGGPVAIPTANMTTGTGTMNANQAGASSGYGMYLGIPLTTAGSHAMPTAEQVQTYASNITITILDP